MGRKGPSGLSSFLTLVAFLLLQGCHQPAPGPVDPGSGFTVTGNEISRELGIYSGNSRVGDMKVSMKDGVWGTGTPATELAEDVSLRLSFRGDRFSLRSEQTGWVDEDLNLLGSKETMDFGAGKWETRAILMDGYRYEVVRSSLGNEKRQTVSLPPGAVASPALPLYMQRHAGAKGKRTEVTIFNMSLGQKIPFSFTDEGLTDGERLFKVSYWGMGEKIWLDSRGLVAREEMALGVQARSPGGLAEEKPAYLALETVLAATAVPAVNIPQDLGRREEAQLVLEGSFKAPPSGTWQKVEMEGNRALVRLVRPVPPPPGERKSNAGVAPPDEPELDLGSPRIRELASKITGSLNDPWEKALAIGNWVYDNLGKSMKECFTALQVLETGEGECQSHSLLTVALCRAAGIPARFAYGVVYMHAGEAFFFHTWVEVYAGQWIPIDPTLGNFPSGVDHLTLAVGGYRDQFSIFPYVMSQGGWRISIADTN